MHRILGSHRSFACSNGGKFQKADRIAVAPLAASGGFRLILLTSAVRRHLGDGHPTLEDAEVGVPWLGPLDFDIDGQYNAGRMS